MIVITAMMMASYCDDHRCRLSLGLDLLEQQYLLTASTSIKIQRSWAKIHSLYTPALDNRWLLKHTYDVQLLILAGWGSHRFIGRSRKRNNWITSRYFNLETITFTNEGVGRASIIIRGPTSFCCTALYVSTERRLLMGGNTKMIGGSRCGLEIARYRVGMLQQGNDRFTIDFFEEISSCVFVD